MFTPEERAAMAGLWARKTDQDARRLPRLERHRNLHPASAELLAALAMGLGAKRILEIGGSSGLSTIALAAAARRTEGRVTSIEIEPVRQAEARETLAALGHAGRVEFLLGDAATILLGVAEPERACATPDMDLVLLDCEKEDYARFLDLLVLSPGAVVVADNVLSHDLAEYVAHVRAKPGVESVTLAVGQGLELSRFTRGQPARG
ncbi:MAG: DUF1442 domain-containing protein [Planctomycetes bacterium]|nr:DUF1442 domain-containing protein [Planctomycetota bacterium]